MFHSIDRRKYGAYSILLSGILLLGLLASCGNDKPSTPNTSGETTTSIAAVDSAVAETVLPDASALAPEASPTPAVPAVITLTWWTPPGFAPSEETAAGQLLALELETLQAANSTTVVEPVLKAPHGEGGLLDFLLTAQKVAPSILPDLVTLDSEDLGVAMRAGLLQPLDELLPQELLNDLYPFALDVGRLDDKLYAVQFEADIEHAVVRSEEVPAPPRTWDDVLAGEHDYVFPTGTENNPGDSFLIQYQAAGGRLSRRNEPFVLNEQALLHTLQFYDQARESGIVPAIVLGMDSIEDTWQAFDDGRADIANVLASRYLAERSRTSNLGFGPVPTQSGTPATMSHGWTLAVTATDPERQAAVARLIEALLRPELSSAWTQASNRIPTRRSALALWNQDDPYTSFLRWQLEAAAFTTAESSYLKAAPILAAAQRDVLNGTLTPQEATERATGLNLP